MLTAGAKLNSSKAQQPQTWTKQVPPQIEPASNYKKTRLPHGRRADYNLKVG